MENYFIIHGSFGSPFGKRKKQKKRATKNYSTEKSKNPCYEILWTEKIKKIVL